MNDLAAHNPDVVLARPIDWLSRHRRRWVIGLCLAVLAVYVANLSAEWWVGKDGALYLILARNLARGEGYTLAGQPHTLVPPGYPMMLAGLMKLGLDGFLALNLFMGLLGLATAWVSYLLLRQLVHRDWALLLAAAFALCLELVQRSGEILSDVPYSLTLLAALWLYARGLRSEKPDRRGWELASLLLAAGCWFRMAGFIVAAGAALGLLLSAWRRTRGRALLNVGIVALACLATLAVFYVHAQGVAGPATSDYVSSMDSYLGQFSLAKRLGMPLYRFWQASREFCRLLIAQEMPNVLCLLLLIAPAAATMGWRIRRGDRVGPMAVTFYIGGMCAAMVLIRTRYLLPVAPLLMLYFVQGWAWLVGKVRPAAPHHARRVAVGLVALMVAFNLPKVGRMIAEKHSGDYATAQQDGQWRDLPEVVDWLREHRPADGVVISPFAYAYLADVPTVLLARRVRFAELPPEKVDALLADLSVRYVIFEIDDEFPPLYRAIHDRLSGFGPPAFQAGNVQVYEVPVQTPASPASAPAAATSPS